MNVPMRNAKHDEAFMNRLDLTLILHFRPIAAQPTHPSSSGPSAQQLIPILAKEENAVQNSDTSDSKSLSVRRSKRQMKKQRKQTVNKRKR